MRARSIAALGVLVAGIAWLPAPAHAQGKLTKAQIAEARQHYLAATEAERKGSYDAAIREFIAAYDITMDPVLFYQIAKAHELAGHLDDALTFYRRYLAEAQVSGEGQTDVSARITDLEKKKQARDTARPGDGGAGAGGDEGGGDGGLGGGDGAPPTFMDSGSRWQRTAAWVSVGLAAGFLTAGGVFATSANSREEDVDRLVSYRDANDLPSEYTGTIRSQYEDALSEGDKLDTYAKIAFIGAGVATGAAVVFFILDSTGRRSEPEETARRPSLLGVAPSVGEGGAGLSATWTF